MDWDLTTRFEARALEKRLREALPGQWGKKIGALSVIPENVPDWLKARTWLDQLEAFKQNHGDAVEWNISDDLVCQKAKDYAVWVGQLFDLKNPDCIDAEKLDKVCAVCDVVGVEYPVSLTTTGAVNRVLCDVWWRRSLRRKVARVVELGAIKLGVVNRKSGGYCSNSAVNRRKKQLARNAAMMKKTLLRNEAGQVFALSELAEKSVANPAIRGGELMVRIRGCEEFADAAGHVGYFLTLTCPSKFHAVLSGGKGRAAVIRPNPKYDGESSPRDAQLWLRDNWAKVRAAWARKGITAYGFRVAEPHHDGCPHWHCLLWFADDKTAIAALAVVGKYWLSDGGGVEMQQKNGADVVRFVALPGSTHEPGALKNRINVKRLHAGGAAGYVAKYVAKNIGHFDVGQYTDHQGPQVMDVDTREHKGWERVDAWASTWGIRQFQAIGQPSVGVWREMRRVTKDQIDTAHMAGDKVASKVWYATQKIGMVGADWCRYMVHQGGVCLKRLHYRVTVGLRVNDKVNGYGEPITEKKVVGCLLKSGRLLVSRRQSWEHVGAEIGIQESDEREALGAPWTGFNNCTARLGGKLRAALMGFESMDGRDAWGPLPSVWRGDKVAA